MKLRGIVAVLGVVSAVSLPGVATPALAQPSADQVLADFGLSADDKQKVMNGEFVTPDVKTVSDRDLAVSVVFLVKTSPEALTKQIMSGDLMTADSQVKTHGRFSTPGSLADLANLKIGDDVAKTLSGARAGDALNLGTSEIAAFDALQGGTTQAVQAQLQKMLLARYQAYRKSGLAGFVPYDRGSGRTSDTASDLRKASQATPGFEKHMPTVRPVLLGYPQGVLPSMQQDFRWIYDDIQGKATYVLVHMLAVPDGANRTVVQRQYYVSTGYNAEQAVAAFVPVQGGTLVLYASHAFTDQVAGFGGSMKRSIGRRIMASTLEKMFEAGRTKVGQ
jgi:hypothetical protein